MYLCDGNAWPASSCVLSLTPSQIFHWSRARTSQSSSNEPSPSTLAVPPRYLSCMCTLRRWNDIYESNPQAGCTFCRGEDRCWCLLLSILAFWSQVCKPSLVLLFLLYLRSISLPSYAMLHSELYHIMEVHGVNGTSSKMLSPAFQV